MVGSAELDSGDDVGLRPAGVRSGPTGGGWRVAVAMFAVGYGANQIVPMLLVYRHTLGLSEPGALAVLGIYSLGIGPAFLLAGPASDAYGRRGLVLAFTAVSVLASVVLVAGHWSASGLLAGRLLAGFASGIVFAVGSVWVTELAEPGRLTASARLIAVSLSAGFGAGPLVAGAVAGWFPLPDVLPYGVHIAVALAALGVLVRAPETRLANRRIRWSATLRVPRPVRKAYTLVVLPLAPCVFGCATIAFTVLPARSPALAGGGSTVASGLLTALVLAVGVGVQPLARHLDAQAGRATACGAGLSAIGLGIGAWGTWAASPPLLLAGIVLLGAAYGLLLVGGLRQVQRLSEPETLARLVALFYATAYMGTLAPFLMSLAARVLGFGAALGAAAMMAAALLAATALTGRRLGSNGSARYDRDLLPE
jgi:predicted MFS family arabinose efflux permease